MTELEFQKSPGPKTSKNMGASLFRRFSALCLLALLHTTGFAADDFPSRPVTIIVPFTAGGPTDAFFRAIADGLQKEWGQPVIVDNKPGANETIAAMATVRAAKDGYTLFGASEGALILNPLLYRKLQYNPHTQLAPISLLAKGPLVLVVPASMPVRTMKEFIEYARSRSNTNPVTYGTTGMGGTTHLSFSALQKQNNIVMTAVNYKGIVNVVQDLLGGNLEAAVVGPSMAEGYVKTGKLKALAIPFARASSLPDVPTFAEAGVTDMKAAYELTLVGPAGTPATVIEKISRDARKVLLSQEFQKKNVEPFGLVTVGSNPKEFAEYLRTESLARKKLVADSGVEIQD
ncbi:MAG: tripartite tricarboxylate transporter substrate binding protein [Burkholderiaceae bacterium]|nr:tripartite tricarboxylate transporter substrate binding protein [Burkholderiaceae bacterium]